MTDDKRIDYRLTSLSLLMTAFMIELSKRTDA